MPWLRKIDEKMAAPMTSKRKNESASYKDFFSDPAFPVYISGFLDLFGVGMFLPLIPSHARALGASPTLAGILGSVYGALQLFSSPLFGQWSDVAGRRFILLLCLFISACGYTLFSLATSIIIMFVARIPLGLFKHSQTIEKSYLADITPEVELATKVGHFNGASSVGFIIGPAVGGHIAEMEHGFYIVSLLTGIIFFVNCLLIWLFVPTERQYKPGSLERKYSATDSLNQIQSDELNYSTPSFFRTIARVRWRDLWDLYFIKFLLGAAVIIFRSNFSLILMQKFNTTPVINGYVISFGGIVSALVGFVTGKISRYYNNNNAKLFHHLACLQVLTMITLAMSPCLWIFVLCLIPLSLITTVSRVTGTSLMLERGNNEEIGLLMGFQQTCMSVARMFAPLIAGLTQEICLSGPEIFGAMLSLVSVFIMWYRPQDPRQRKKLV